MQSLDYKYDNYSRNESDNSILSLGKNPLNIISSTLSNIAESPLNGKNSKYLRSDYRKKNIAKKSSSFSSAISSRPTSFNDENGDSSNCIRSAKRIWYFYVVHGKVVEVERCTQNGTQSQSHDLTYMT